MNQYSSLVINCIKMGVTSLGDSETHWFPIIFRNLDTNNEWVVQRNCGNGISSIGMLTDRRKWELVQSIISIDIYMYMLRNKKTKNNLVYFVYTSMQCGFHSLFARSDFHHHAPALTTSHRLCHRDSNQLSWRYTDRLCFSYNLAAKRNAQHHKSEKKKFCTFYFIVFTSVLIRYYLLAVNSSMCFPQFCMKIKNSLLSFIRN